MQLGNQEFHCFIYYLNSEESNPLKSSYYKTSSHIRPSWHVKNDACINTTCNSSINCNTDVQEIQISSLKKAKYSDDLLRTSEFFLCMN